MAHTIFVSWPGFRADDAATGARLVAAGHALLLEPKLGARGEDDVIAFASHASAAIVSTDPFSARVLAACPMLRVIARVGVGYDSIDIEEATRRGVAVTITPGLNAEPVADQAVAMMLALVRKVVPQDANVKSGRWERIGALTPTEMPGRTVGLIGGGSIGRLVARRLAGFDVRVLVYDPAAVEVPGAQRVETLDELLAAADIVSLHLPRTPATENILSAERIGRMKPGAFLVNTARGGLVDEAALFEALRSGRLGGAALDTFATEPPGAAALDGVPNLVTSAHMGGISIESVRRMTASATESVLAVLSGRVPDTVVNPEALAVRRGAA